MQNHVTFFVFSRAIEQIVSTGIAKKYIKWILIWANMWHKCGGECSSQFIFAGITLGEFDELCCEGKAIGP